MPVIRAVERLNSTVRPEDQCRFVTFLRSRHVEQASAEMPLQARLYHPHRVVRPVEYAAQGMLGLHPEAQAVRRLVPAAYEEFGEACDRYALLVWAQQVLGEDDAIPAALGDVLETWVIERPIAESKEVVEGVVATLLERVQEYGLHKLTPPAISTSAFLVLSHELLGAPQRKVLEHCVEAFRGLTQEVTGHLPASVLVVGAMLWRALDVGVLDESAMRPLVEDFPELLRVLDSHLLLGTTRVSAAVPAGSRTERFLEKLCLERLEAMTEAPHFHTINGPFKNVPLWPGRDVAMRALQRLEEIGEVSTDEREETIGSSLWHVLRHTRLRQGEALPQDQLEQLSDSTLCLAAVIAPWWAEQFATVRELAGLDDFVAFCHGQARSLVPPQDVHDELPRIESQIRQAIANRGLRTQAERDRGIIELPWLRRAQGSLHKKHHQTVLQALPYLRAEPTGVEEILAASSGETESELKKAAEHGESRAIRLLGVLPLPSSKAARDKEVRTRFELLRKHWRSHAPAESRIIANKQTAGREDARIGATNLAIHCGHEHALQLAWALGEACFETTELELPVLVQERYNVEATLDETGIPVLEVIKLYPNERPLKTVPRDVSDSAEFRDARRGLAELRPMFEGLCTLLERSMILGSPIEVAILARLMRHPIGRLVVPALVFFEEDSDREGMPELDQASGQFVLRGLDGGAHVLSPECRVSLAHPLHLEARRMLKPWREALIAKRVTQPIAQLFRAFERAKVSSRARKIGVAAAREVALAPFARTLQQLHWDIDVGLMPCRAFAGHELAVSWPMQHAAEPEAIFARGSGATGEIRFSRLTDQESVSLRDVPEVVIGEALRDAALAVTAGELAPTASSAAVRETRAALIEHLAVTYVARINPRVPVEARVSEGVLTIEFVPDGGPGSLRVEVQIDSAHVTLDGSPIELPLPSLRRAPYVPHPLRPPMRETVRLMARIFQAIDHKRDDFRAAVQAAQPARTDKHR